MIHPGRGFDAEKMAVYEGDGQNWISVGSSL